MITPNLLSPAQRKLLLAMGAAVADGKDGHAPWKFRQQANALERAGIAERLSDRVWLWRPTAKGYALIKLIEAGQSANKTASTAASGTVIPSISAADGDVPAVMTDDGRLG